MSDPWRHRLGRRALVAGVLALVAGLPAVPAAQPIPTVAVTASAPQVRPEDTLTLGVTVENPAGAVAADLYVGAVFPDGRGVIVLDGAGRVAAVGDLARPSTLPPTAGAPPGFRLAAPAFARLTLPTFGVGPGRYTVFAALVRAGALGDGRVDAGDLVGLATTPVEVATGRFRLGTRGIYVLNFERRGAPAQFHDGEVIAGFGTVDPLLGHTLAEEVALQLDRMREMGVNISFELRATDPGAPGDALSTFPTCTITPATGVDWPRPTAAQLANLRAFYDLVASRGMRVLRAPVTPARCSE